MRNEHHHLHGQSARWRFSLGCVWGAMLIRLRTMVSRPAPGTASSRTFVLAEIGAALCLASYGPLHYPELRSDPTIWVSLTFFLAVLAGYALIAIALSSKNTGNAKVASRYGLTGGLLIGGAWFVILAPTSLLKNWVALPLMIVLIGPALSPPSPAVQPKTPRRALKPHSGAASSAASPSSRSGSPRPTRTTADPTIPGSSATSTTAEHTTSPRTQSATTSAADSSCSSSCPSSRSPSGPSLPASPTRLRSRRSRSSNV